MSSSRASSASRGSKGSFTVTPKVSGGSGGALQDEHTFDIPEGVEAVGPLATPGRHRTRTGRSAPALLEGDLAARARPVCAASDRVLEVPGPLGEVLPGGGLHRGQVVTIEGGAGSGATSVALALSAAVTAVGEWVAWVDDASLGGLAAAEAGLALDRLALVRDVPRDRWASVVGALVEGVGLVVAAAPAGRVRRADARRLAARARERGSALAVLGAWPDRAAFRLTAAGTAWRFERGRLVEVARHVELEHRGAPRRGRVLAPAG